MTKYERGDRFLEDLSYMSDDSGMSEFVRDHQTVYEIGRVLEDKDTGEMFYWLKSVKGFETQLMTADEIENMEAYSSEEEVGE